MSFCCLFVDGELELYKTELLLNLISNGSVATGNGRKWGKGMEGQREIKIYLSFTALG